MLHCDVFILIIATTKKAVGRQIQSGFSGTPCTKHTTSGINHLHTETLQ